MKKKATTEIKQLDAHDLETYQLALRRFHAAVAQLPERAALASIEEHIMRKYNMKQGDEIGSDGTLVCK